MKPTWTSDCGTVRLWLGDCLEVMATWPDEAVDAVVTDPPYGIAYRNKRTDLTGRKYADELQGDTGRDPQIAIDWMQARSLPLCVFASHRTPWEGVWRQFLVWDKGPAVGGGGDQTTCWKFTWELIQVGGFGELNGGRDSAVLRYWVGQRDSHHHPTQKPCELMEYLLYKLSTNGQTIADPFMGSGTTGVAAVRLGRQFWGVEIDPEYFEIAKRRIQDELRRVDFLEGRASGPKQRELAI